MDDLSEKLADILNDPESMEKVRKMAENIFSGDNSSVTQDNSKTDTSNFPSGEDIQTIMSVVSKLNGQKDDERTKLLHALKPYLSQNRQEKAENAIKILKLLELLPIIKESGILKL